MDPLVIKSLVITGAEDQDFLAIAKRAGYHNYELETTTTNMLSRLKDPSFDLCIIYESSFEIRGTLLLVERLRANSLTKQVPIAVITSRDFNPSEDHYYDNGVQFVNYTRLDRQDLVELLCMCMSWLNFSEQFKLGRERLFRKNNWVG